MTCSEKELTREEMSRSVERMQRDAFFSYQDGCYVIEMLCENCGCQYEEEAGEATNKMIRGGKFLCLGCDKGGLGDEVIFITVRLERE